MPVTTNPKKSASTGSIATQLIVLLKHYCRETMSAKTTLQPFATRIVKRFNSAVESAKRQAMPSLEELVTDVLA